MDAEVVTADAPVARWRAVAVHHKPALAAAWLTASSLAFAPMPSLWRAAWVALVTVSFALLVLVRIGTEARAEVFATASHVVVRYRSGHVERIALDSLTGAERVTSPHPRWVFRFGREARLALPDERDASELIEVLRAHLPKE